MSMGDHRAGSSGTTATTIGAPTPGKRVARHSAEQRTSQPYVGRRVAQVAPTPPVRIPAPIPVAPPPPVQETSCAGRRVAGRDPVVPPPAPDETVRLVGRRIPIDVDCPGDSDDVAGHLFRATAAPTLTPYVGRRVATTVPLITELEPVPEPEPLPVVDLTPCVEAAPPVFEAAPLVDLAPIVVIEESLVAAPAVQTPLVVEDPALDTAPVPEVPEEPVVEPVVQTVEAPVLVVDPELTVPREKRPDAVRTAKRTRPSGRRVATRRARVPSLPLLAGVAVLAISAGGALQAMHPGLAGADADGHLSPAGALSGSSAVSSANVLGGRGSVVSRDSNRQALSGAGSLQAAADAQSKQRDQALSEFAAKAEKRAAQVKLHQWVLPITPGVYHLTARFGEYSYLWSNMHTGLDFAAPTGTPIMAVAGGTITEVGYSGAYGNRTIELLPDGTELWYCHQNEFGTSVGATVKPGQVIGYVGSTGNVTGPHLHLEVHPGGGDPVDPYTALQVHGLNP
jgi:murein DD-endopeptidase MepM/ murein hydrolase activator NlpD